MKIIQMLLTAATIGYATIAGAQGVAVNTTGTTADPSAMLDVSSTTQGILVPRMDSAHRVGISTSAVGLLVYQTDGTAGFYYYASGGWTALSTPATSSFNDTLTQNLYTNGFLLSGDGMTGIVLKDNGQLVDKGDYGSGSELAESGAGVKMFWYPRQAAFRAGGVSGATWDDANIGPYSTAFGSSTEANGAYATAMGGNTIASGAYATATGFGTNASGYYATAMGNTTTASGDEAVAMGYNTTANSSFSTAMGGYTTASNLYATAMGYYTTASGVEAVSMGYNTTASGSYSIAMGSNTVAGGTASLAMGNAVSTGTYSGCLIAGDYSTASVLNSSTYNQMTMRFAGGYRLYSNSSSSAGVTLAFGGGSWSSISDRRKKENFTPLDKEDMLIKICAMPVTRWNYKSQPTTQKHVGPMAQDFYAAFGLDGVGADTTINTVDIDGVNMIAIQALEKRTEKLQKENDALRAQLAIQNTDFAARMDKVEAMLSKKEEEQKLSVK